ncbi:antibiotic ABC transporter ATP-binding protein [Bacillus coahuilensis p1.1.43]|uniref:Antibiotic ABC transporter ATP-binding protein n=1 Tax=Bacillus coahuilensis p1.1.43 TaxID=1150625 RepID=A0A147KBJ0_9BACI|nr:ABC transporter ATP-binding protein [Bacillus coahuilensis]KUP08737.1 antibiotic ABC transporter ATP-binding protein [Bacillus coahuilensis p1.1.43]
MLEVKKVSKSFGKRDVVKDISFHVQTGESFGLLGPNGAGKSTTISMICGLLSIDKGDIMVGGLPVSQKSMEVKRRIGIVPQEIALYPSMSARDNLIFWGKMYGLSGKEAKIRSLEVLEFIGLSNRGNDKIDTFSGGMKRRVNIGAALMHHPSLLIMDEPTVGIDPQSRNHILETVKQLNNEGMTVIYTSHYMEEVEYLCSRIGIIDHGEVIALGTKNELTNRIAGGTIIELTLQEMKEEFIEAVTILEEVEKVHSFPEELKMEIFVSDSHRVLGQLISLSTSYHCTVTSVDVKEPNLETLFLQLTGRTLRD